MNLAFYLPNGIYGGGERILLTLMSEMKKRGHKIIVYSTNKEVKLHVKQYKVEIHPQSKTKLLLSATKSLIYNKVDALIIFGTMTPYFVAAKFAKVKVIHSLRIDPSYIKMNKLGNWFVYHFSDAHVFQTNVVLNHFDNYIRKKSIVIFNPIMDDLPALSSNKEKKIAVVGRLSVEKNQRMAIEAFAKIQRNGYTMHIFGQGPLEYELKELVRYLNLENDVIFEGQVEKVVEKIKNYEILLLTSNSEGMPNALIEGMAMGLACITTNFPSGAAYELINNGENGLIVEMNNVEQLSERLQVLINDLQLRRSIQINSAKIREKLEKESIITQWVELINKVLMK